MHVSMCACALTHARTVYTFCVHVYLLCTFCVHVYLLCTFCVPSVHVLSRDLPPNLQQGVGFGIYINIGGGQYKSLPSALLNGMPCCLILTWHVQTRGWVSQIRDKLGGGSRKSLPSVYLLCTFYVPSRYWRRSSLLDCHFSHTSLRSLMPLLFCCPGPWTLHHSEWACL